MEYKKQPQESRIISNFYSADPSKKNLENSVIENFDYVARGKGGIKDKCFAYRTRLPYLNNVFRKEISKKHLKNEQLEKLKGSLSYLEKRTKELKAIPLDEKEGLIRHLRAYISHEEWLLKENAAQEEINQRREQYLKKTSAEKIGLKGKFLAAAFAMLLPWFCAKNLNKDIRIPKIAPKNDETRFAQNFSYTESVPIYIFHDFNDSGKMYSKPLKYLEDFLEEKNNQGYYLASEQEYLENKFCSPRKPMMLTFDDSAEGQIEAKKIIENFSEKHENFGKALTFCLIDPDHSFNKSFYEEIKQKDGIKITLHTHNHKRLDRISAEQCIKEEIEPEYKELEEYLGEKILKVNTLACPYGILPSKKNLEAIKNYIYHSKYGDVKIECIFGNFGTAKNSKDGKFDRWNIQRICVE